MEYSLSALLPVRNAEATLAETVSEWLEVLPELTNRFDLVIIDDCSSDATIEVADELVKQYAPIIRSASPTSAGSIRSHRHRTATGSRRGDLLGRRRL